MSLSYLELLSNEIPICQTVAVCAAGHVGQVIAWLRETKGWTQADLAENSGLSRGTIVDVEKARRGTRKDTLPKIAQALGTDVPSIYAQLLQWAPGRDEHAASGDTPRIDELVSPAPQSQRRSRTQGEAHAVVEPRAVPIPDNPATLTDHVIRRLNALSDSLAEDRDEVVGLIALLVRGQIAVAGYNEAARPGSTGTSDRRGNSGGGE